MYWLIGSLIIITMIGVLAVADSMAIPISPLLVDILNTPILSLSLIIFAIILIVIAQFNVPSAQTSHLSQDAASLSSHNPSHNSKPFFRILNHILVAVLAIGLIIGSALQALISHQQAEVTAITEPMRVQALVTIEGISDGVYDVATDSSYRQVAIISDISPLVSALAVEDLDGMTSNFLKDDKNSLSNNKLYKNNSNKNNSKDITYRVLLNAYPKKSSKQSSKKNLDNNPFDRLNYLQPGDQLFMSLALAPLATSEQALSNPSGFDSYRWLRGRHIDGVANILTVGTSTVTDAASSKPAPASSLNLQRFQTYINQGRWQLRQHFYQDWSTQSTAAQQAKAVTLSLLTGDRSLINRETKDLYQLAGISHLLAISGTHVLFLAIMLAGAVVLLFDRLWPSVYRYVPRWQVRWWVMIAAAFIYALFTGFDVPAARTAWMLLAIGLVRLTLLPISTMRVLFALAVLMAWLDPYVLWQAGYWLSFIAVALLLKYDDASYTQSAVVSKTVSAHRASVVTTVFKRVWIIGKRVFKLQFWLFITLLPITLLLFAKASLWGLVINLFAIGLFGWVIVPLNLLAGLCYLLSPALADSIWLLVSAIVAKLHELITWLTSLPALSEAWLYTPVNVAILLMVLLSMLPWLLPRGFISRWLALPPLTLLMMAVYANQQSLTTIPTLYILPTGDPYISATLLQYPIANDEQPSTTDKYEKNISWLFLADHRPSAARTMPSNLAANQLSMTLAQQLGSLSVDTLEGIVVQSSSVGLTDTLTTDKKRLASHASASELLPLTVFQLNQRLPISQYWQAGRSDRWSAFQQAYKVTSQPKDMANISVQRCEQGKTWQLGNSDLSIQALTGWGKIDSPSVWDCTVAIDASLPIRVLKYNAADPLKSSPATGQTLTSSIQPPTYQANMPQARLILNADTHQRIWQMWTLLCSVESHKQPLTFSNVTWLGHSTSQITTDVIERQTINKMIGYDDKMVEATLSLNVAVDAADMTP
ncbi:ComEC/Rec2 family competence protein [Psychrobacter aquimaris]|uniref:ComEC/Rec2 family competence protein n=1 Tax=Psychrobacter TaxID=497 RepID=UPI000EC80290|nr:MULTISPECIES: ComEC/Rec2 family competence protein [Psychrobacter]HCT73699.1 competence protein ComEC [Psychrobacter sp.]